MDDDDEPVGMEVDDHGRPTFLMRHIAAVVEPTDVHTRLTLRRIEGIVTDQPRVNGLILWALCLLSVVTIGLAWWAVATRSQLNRIELTLTQYLETR